MKQGRGRNGSRSACIRRREQRGTTRFRRLWFEELEERRVLAGFPTINFVVDIADDESDSDFSPGDLSLREALSVSNSDQEVRTITFANNLDGQTILLTMGELAVQDSVTIDASALSNGIVIDATGNDPTPTSTHDDGNAGNDGDGSRVFNIDDGESGATLAVSLIGLTITGGDTFEGGAIFSSENLTIDGSTVSNNQGFLGGGIHSPDGSLTVMRSAIRGNAASGFGGGIHISNSDLFISDSTVSGNTATTFGGGIDLDGVNLATIVRSTISGNRLRSNVGRGGGLYAEIISGQLSVTDSTVSGNTAGRGGGIYGSTESGSISLTNTTISGNSAAGNGGGLLIDSNGTTIVAHSTITANTSDADLANGGSGGGLFHVGDGVLNIGHTILAENTDNTGAAPDINLADPPATLNFTFSLIGNSAGSGLNAGNGNIVGTASNPINPQLGALSANGGPTQTHALLAGSPAFDAGDANVASAPEFDQRGDGFRRVVGRIDIGAIEAPNSSPVLTVPGSQTIDEGSGLSLAPLVSFVDVNGSNTYTVTIDWDDGQTTTLPNASLGALSVDHDYADNGDYTVAITVDDNLGGTDTESFLLTVANVLPTLVVPGAQSIAEDQELSIADLGVIVDPGYRRSPGDETFRYWINWGDGTSADEGTATIDDEGGAQDFTDASFDGAHAFATAGSYKVTVRVADDDMTGDFADGAPGSDFVEQTFSVRVDPVSAILTNASGPGTVSITVDGYGTFRTAMFDPVGSLDAADTTFDSNVAVRGAALPANGFLGEVGVVTQPGIVSNGTTATSSFTFGPLRFVLTQRIEPILTVGAMRGTRLVQTYVISRTPGTPVEFELLRYLDGDLEFGNDGGERHDDNGGFIMLDGQETLFETDTVGGQIDQGTFVGITATGGSMALPGRYMVDQFSQLEDRINGGGTLTDTVINDSANDADQLTDRSGTDIALAFRNLFALAEGESVQYETSTIFLSSAPPDVDFNGSASGDDVSLAAIVGGVVSVGGAGPAAINDADSESLAQVVVRVVEPPIGFVYNLNANAGTTGIEVSFSSGVLTLGVGQSDGSVEAFEQVLRTLTFQILSTGGAASPISIEVVATDELGLTGTATATVSFQNRNPDVTVPATQTTQFGSSFSLASLVSFTDPDVFDTHRVTVDWGDDTPILDLRNAPRGAVSGEHAYVGSGTFVLTVTVTDNEGASDVDTFTLRLLPIVPREPPAPPAPPAPPEPGPPSPQPPPIIPIVVLRPVVERGFRILDSDVGSGGQVINNRLPVSLPRGNSPARDMIFDSLAQSEVPLTDEIYNAVYALADFELVTLVGYDMGDEPMLQRKEKPKKQDSVGTGTKQETFKPPISDAPAPSEDGIWDSPALWGALAGGTLWLGGAWWLRAQRRQRPFNGGGEITG